jgi:hypothetical protein
MAVAKSIPSAPRARRSGASSFEREYLIRRGLLRPSPTDLVKLAKLARLLQGGAV